jgi:hypothetical protein
MRKSKEGGSQDGGRNDKTTTISTRKWVVENHLKKLQELIARSSGSALPPELMALAQEAGPDAGGWPQWLVVGIALRQAHEWYEARLAENQGEER